MPAYTWCCINDWFAIGPVRDVMDLYGFVFSLSTMSSMLADMRMMPLGGFGWMVPPKDAAKANATVPPKPSKVPEDPPIKESVQLGFGPRWDCFAEQCMGKTLLSAGVKWALAKVPVTIGAEAPKFDTSRSAPGCVKKCPTL